MFLWGITRGQRTMHIQHPLWVWESIHWRNKLLHEDQANGLSLGLQEGQLSQFSGSCLYWLWKRGVLSRCSSCDNIIQGYFYHFTVYCYVLSSLKIGFCHTCPYPLFLLAWIRLYLLFPSCGSECLHGSWHVTWPHPHAAQFDPAGGCCMFLQNICIHVKDYTVCTDTLVSMKQYIVDSQLCVGHFITL